MPSNFSDNEKTHKAFGMNMAIRNITSGLLLLGITAFYAWLTLGLPSRDIMPNTPGPSFFPWLIVILTACLSTALVVKGFRTLDKERHTKSSGSIRLPAMMIGGFIAYVIALRIIGFVPASSLFFAYMMWLFSERRALYILIAAVIAPLALYFVFSKWFQVLLPVGPLGI